MNDVSTKDLSPQEKESLDRQMEQLEPILFEAKDKYDELLSKYHELYEKRHPEKREERIKETLFQAYRESDRSLDQILSFMAGEDDDEWA